MNAPFFSASSPASPSPAERLALQAALMREQLAQDELSAEQGQALMRHWLATQPTQAHAVLCLLYGLSWYQWAETAHLFPDAEAPQSPNVWFLASETPSLDVSQSPVNDCLASLLAWAVQRFELEKCFFEESADCFV